MIGFLWQLTAAAAPKNISVAPVPAWVKQLPQRTQTNIDPDEVNDGFHYLQRSIQWDVAREESFFSNSYKITADEGVQNGSELQISFDPNHEKLYLHRVVVWRDGKPINKLDLNKVKVIQREQGLEQRIYDETLTAVLFLEDIRIGDVVDYAGTIKGRNPVFGGRFFNSFYLQFYDPMDELLVHIVAPEKRKLHYKLHKTEHKPVIATANGNTSYTWHLKDLPATPVDSDLPSWYDPYPGASVTEYTSWKEVVDWALPLFGLKETPSPALQAKIDSIKATNRTHEERVTAALRFVQDEVRYLGMEAGIGGYKPQSPSKVFAQRFGDCKDKSLLLCTMLQGMGIEAYPALVNSSYKGQIKQHLPSPYAFNHCIVQVNLKSNKLWYDPTISKQRGTSHSIFLPDYQQALVLNASSKGLTEIFPNASHNAGIKLLETFLFNDVGGAVTLQVKTEYNGSEADYQRSRFASTSMKEIQKSYLNFYANNYPDIEVARPVEFIDYESGNKFTTLEEYTIENLWEEQEGVAGQLHSNFYPQVLRNYISQPRASKRTMPMGLTYPVNVEHEIQVFLPERWPVQPASKEVKDEAFIYKSEVSYAESGNLLTMRYTYTTLQDHVAPENISAFVRNQKILLDDLGQSLTYNNNLLGGESFRFSWVMLALALLALAGAVYGGYRLYDYDPNPAPGFRVGGGEHITGWLILPLIALFSTPLVGTFAILSNGYFNQTVWENLILPSSSTFAPALAGLMALELFVNIGFVVFSVVLLRLFLKRRTSVPGLMVAFYVGNFLFMLGEYLALEAMVLPFQTEKNTPNEAIRMFFMAAIWVPYFHLSHRVKETFVVMLRPPFQEEQDEWYEEPVDEESELSIR